MAVNTKPWIATVYFYLISAVCIITLIFAGINGLMALYSVLDPETNLDKREWQAYADLEEFKRTELGSDLRATRDRGSAPADSGNVARVVSDEEWQKRWNSHRAVVLRAEVMSGKRNLVNQIVVIVVCLPLFFIHWRFARRSTSARSESSDNSIDN